MKVKKIGVYLVVCLMTALLSGTMFANEARPFIVTQDMTITANQAAGGIGCGLYTHYGDFQYDGEAYLENTGTRPFEFTLTTASGRKVYSDTIAPGESRTMPLLQTILLWNLSDGQGKVRIATPDGGDGQGYFRYIILN